jgi:hypoxanthine phosphoribosyltransferase
VAELRDSIERVLLSEDKIRTRVAELGAEISRDYAGRELLLVGVLKGAVIFIADLARAVTSPLGVDFVAVSSYGSATKTSGVVRILKDLDEDIKDRHVLMVEDILDTGLTVRYLMKLFRNRGPASLEVCTLLSKEGKQRVPIECKYVGFKIPDEFVIGYGLDCDEHYRNLPYIATLKAEAEQA